MRRTLRAVVAICSLLVVTACGDDGGEATATTTTTSTTEASTSTTVASTSTTSGSTSLPEEPPLRDDAASGSGCTPGGGDLPSGWWYGTIDDPSDGSLEFDLACYYVGEAAEAAAAERGDEVNNDHYVVNDNSQKRTVTVRDDATASCVAIGAGPQPSDCDPSVVTGDWAVWIRIQDGAVDRIVEQYAP